MDSGQGPQGEALAGAEPGGHDATQQSEQMAILRLVESRQVSVEEAVHLLQAVAPLRGHAGGRGAGYRFEQELSGQIAGEGLAELALQGTNGSVTLRGCDGAEARLVVRIHVRGAASEQEARSVADCVTASIAGRRLEVRCGPVQRSGPRGLAEAVGGLAVAVEASLPRAATWGGEVATSNGAVEVEAVTLRGLRIASSNGAVRLRGCSGQDVGVATSNGAVETDGTEVDGLRVTTSNGALRLRGHSGDGLAATTSNAAVEAEGLRGRVEIRTSNSHILLGLAQASAEVQASTSNAGIEVRLPQGLPVDIDAATSHGSFETAALGPNGPQSGDKDRGRLAWRSPGWEGAEARARLVLRTSNGGVRFVTPRP